MKKLILAICFAVLSVGAYAKSENTTIPELQSNSITKEETKTNYSKTNVTTSHQKLKQLIAGEYTYVSACGEVWDISWGDDTNPSVSILNFAEDLADAACGTDIIWITIYY